MSISGPACLCIIQQMCISVEEAGSEHMTRGSSCRISRAATSGSNTDSVSSVSAADETLSAHPGTNKHKQQKQQVTSTPHRLLTNRGETCQRLNHLQAWINKQLTCRTINPDSLIFYTRSLWRAETRSLRWGRTWKITDATITVCQWVPPSDWKGEINLKWWREIRVCFVGLSWDTFLIKTGLINNHSAAF